MFGMESLVLMSKVLLEKKDFMQSYLLTLI